MYPIFREIMRSDRRMFMEMGRWTDENEGEYQKSEKQWARLEIAQIALTGATLLIGYPLLIVYILALALNVI